MAERLTHSKRRDFLNCPRYYYLRHEENLSLIAQKSGRRRGSIFGDALQAARDKWDFDRTHDGPLPDRQTAIEVALDSVDTSYDSIHPRDQAQADELEVERSKLRVITRAYIVHYGLTARREVEYDMSFRHPRTGGWSKTFRLAGKIDGMEQVRPKVARIVEDKLVGQIQKAMIDRLPLDAQTSEYVWAVRSRGWEAEVAYRHTRLPGLNPEAAKEYKTRPNRPAESLPEFEARLWADVETRKPFYFDEQVLVFPAVHLAEFEAERWNVGQMIIEARARAVTEGPAAFPKNPSRCWEYGGCEFIPLCTMRPDAGALYFVDVPNPELSERSEDGSIASEYPSQAGGQ